MFPAFTSLRSTKCKHRQTTESCGAALILPFVEASPTTHHIWNCAQGADGGLSLPLSDLEIQRVYREHNNCSACFNFTFSYNFNSLIQRVTIFYMFIRFIHYVHFQQGLLLLGSLTISSLILIIN